MWNLTLLLLCYTTLENKKVYARRLAYTFAFCECFSQNTSRNTKHSLYTFRISCEFYVLLMPRKNKLRNPLSFCVNTDPGAKCCEMQKVKNGIPNTKKVVRNTPLYTFRFSRQFLRILR